MARSHANQRPATAKQRLRVGKPAGRCRIEPLESRFLLSITLTTLANFNMTNGSGPESALFLDSSGNLYGTAAVGGSHNDGTLFELSGPGYGTFTTLAAFQHTTGGDVEAGLYSDGQGDFFGTAYVGGTSLLTYGTVWEWSPSDGQTPQVLDNLNQNNGQGPQAALISDGDGNLYGTTQLGGDSGDGTVFELQGPTFTNLITLFSFNGADGNGPQAGLYADSSGDLFGATRGGGLNAPGPDSDGTIFELSGPNHGTFTTLAVFNGTDGQYPDGTLIADSSGNLYGTTSQGGNLNDNSGSGYGTVFELAGPSYATITTLAEFNGANGSQPEGSLLMDAAGNLYGTAPFGGAALQNSGAGDGCVYELSAGSHTLNILYNFNRADGQAPYGSLIADSSGNLYGTTFDGGTGGDGTVFELSNTGFVPPIGTLTNGALTINGTNGDDTITLTSDGTNVIATLNGTASQPFPVSGITSITVNGLAGNDNITIESSMPATLGVSVQGGPGDDTITGGPGNDTLGGGAGNDSIAGGPGDDSIKGGQGDDTLAGGKGNDTLFGSLGNDILRGGLGDDSLNGGAGTNQMYGGQGNNTFYAVNGTADQIFAGAATNDVLYYATADNPVIESGVIVPGNRILV